MMVPGGTAAQPSWFTTLIEWVLRSWLELLLTPFLFFVTLPFLAPVAMAAGWEQLGQFLYLLYSPFCHQLPQRSWFLFGEKLTYSVAEISQVYPSTEMGQLRHFLGTSEMGWKVAWSDRMISFYCMTPVFGLVYAVMRRFDWVNHPISRIFLVLALIPLVVDGATHLVNDMLYGMSGDGFRDTNAWLAYLTTQAFPGFYSGDSAGTFNWWMRLLTGVLAAWAIAFFLFPWLDNFIREEGARASRCPTRTDSTLSHYPKNA
jgi:uncharacterized membrane protein